MNAVGLFSSYSGLGNSVLQATEQGPNNSTASNAIKERQRAFGNRNASLKVGTNSFFVQKMIDSRNIFKSNEFRTDH